jgi:4a-hydroxytetrahydrobiopterin dehydratase
LSVELSKKHCVPCEGGTQPMSTQEALKYIEKIPGWDLISDHIEKEFSFKSYLGRLEFAYALGRTA